MLFQKSFSYANLMLKINFLINRKIKNTTYLKYKYFLSLSLLSSHLIISFLYKSINLFIYFKIILLTPNIWTAVHVWIILFNIFWSYFASVYKIFSAKHYRKALYLERHFRSPTGRTHTADHVVSRRCGTFAPCLAHLSWRSWSL